MSHKYTQYAADKDVQSLLMKLADQRIDALEYGRTLIEVGRHFGEILLRELEGKSVYLVCTTEDADYLAKGIVDKLNADSVNFSLACYWNTRTQPFEGLDIKTAPIVKKYEEPRYDKDVLVVLKSIIHGGCVVKYNLLNIIEKIHPERILIMAPVMFHTAADELMKDFNEEINRKFKFITFAVDNDEDGAGNVVPGIGGNIYKRLGFKDQDDKNKFVPNLVKQRRRLFA